MSKQAFDKFINPKPSGGKKKEAIKQEKKKVKAEIRAKADEERQQNAAKYGLVTKENKAQSAGNKFQETRFGKEGAKSRVQGASNRQNTARGANHWGEKNQDTNGKIQGTRNKAQDSRFKRDNKEEKTFDRSAQRRGTKESPQSRFVKHGHETTGTGTKGIEKANYSYTAAPVTDEQMPLNKFVAHAGVCARREAANLVKEGHVKVNGDIVYEPGYKVSAKDKIEVKGKPVFLQKNLVYILLNKPKDYITTAKDPEGRKTVFDLVANATKERIYPVGRLDRNTTGVLLLTNDGELAQKLTHPSFEIKKVYEVRLDKPLTKKDADAILQGVTLEDGFIQADAVGYADVKDKSVIGIEIHSGRNRIVRRLFEFLGYDVKNLDRVMFANLTKKNVDRGKWRLLTEKEIRLLKYMNQSFVRSKRSE
ncbi:rRNA pseudouridine synthase [Ilyomonas limi]|uniref:Pseudouridine synthase n=1 Tax=Ilyomonas limi TaxID=2575867 RepID=A0A4U3L0P2_9BACT|nr:pseudouridine synthase [Ilyomonas limi]TKK67769.1 rRNA pseudouridine synthase [Ilyomonas limi]